MPPFFSSFKCGAGQIFLPNPPDSDTVQLQQGHRCSSQSCAFNTVAVQNGGCCGSTY
jgi:hypothetical protein